MTAIWDVTLPQRTLKDGFTKIPTSNVITTANDRGPVQTRVIGTTNYSKYRVSLNMTTAQVATFEAFFNNTLSSGALEYQWLDPITQVEYYWVIDQSSGNTYALTNLGGEVYNVAFTVIRKDAV